MPAPVYYQDGKPVYNNASPGIGGALKDAISAVAKATAPRSLTEASQREQSQEDDAIGRMRNAQSTDRDNAYSY